MNYNLQPYNGHGDSTGFRTRQWYKEQVFPHIPDLPMPIIGDVGCGNGRLTKMLAGKLGQQVFAIDPACNYDPRYKYKHVHFQRVGLMDWIPGKKFHGLFFFGSMYIMLKNEGFRVIKRCKRLLRPGGVGVCRVCI